MNRESAHKLLGLSVVVLMGLLSGCGPERHAFTEEEVSLLAHYPLSGEDLELAGTLFHVQDAEMAAVLAHSGVLGKSQIGLQSLARQVAEKGFTVLTFDLRGYGQTGGTVWGGQVDKDVQAAIAFLRDQGYTQFVCLGVGLGGLGCAKSAQEPGMAGLVLISVPTSVDELELSAEDFAGLDYPKLVVVADQDRAGGRPFAEMAQTIYDFMEEPKELRVFPGLYHSMELLRSSEHGEQVYDLLLDFFDGL